MPPIIIIEDEGFFKHCSTRFVVAGEIAGQADVIRQRLSVQLRDAAEPGFLAISPDLWSDQFKHNSYLGPTAHFIDHDHILHSVDICCEPYHEINKRSDNVLKVRNETEFDDVLTFLLFTLDSIDNYCCSVSF